MITCRVQIESVADSMVPTTAYKSIIIFEKEERPSYGDNWKERT